MNLDSQQSVCKDPLLEHLPISDLLNLFLAAYRRHVQIKTASLSASTDKQTIHIVLADKPSGCVACIQFDPVTPAFGLFLFSSIAAGSPLPPLEGLRMTRHAKGDAAGGKNSARIYACCQNFSLSRSSAWRRFGYENE